MQKCISFHQRSILFEQVFKIKTKTLKVCVFKVLQTLSAAHYQLCFLPILFSVYDVSNQSTFHKLDQWLNELDTYSTKSEVVKMLVANKIDKVCFLYRLYQKKKIYHSV